MRYQSTKHYGHELGLSACFRQHRATHSHCSLLHGYALSFTFTFGAETLDDYNWVVDFGGLDTLKDALKTAYDHVLLVAEDDPMLDELASLAGLGLANVMVVPRVGCEAFAEAAAGYANMFLRANQMQPRVQVLKVEVREHGANSAIFVPPPGHYDAPEPVRKFFGQEQAA